MNQDFSAVAKVVLFAKNIEMCILLCLNDITCSGFNYDLKNNSCAIKSELGSALLRDYVVGANRTMGNDCISSLMPSRKGMVSFRYPKHHNRG